jgi:large subunit ribosomal protein L24
MPKNKPGEYEVKLRIKKGDNVQVISGKDKGKQGKVLRAFPKTNKLIVEGVNIITKHEKDRQTGRPGPTGVQEVIKGGRIEKPAPLYAPKVMLVCPHCNRPARVQYEFHEGESKLASRKYRVCHHADCGKAID